MFGTQVTRRDFVKVAGIGAAAGLIPQSVHSAAPSTEKTPENLVATLYQSLTPEQRKAICFDWNHGGSKPLRLHVSNNWQITKPNVVSGFFTKDQQELIEALFFGLYHPDWHDRIRKQLRDDAGGYGKHQSIAIFGTPDDGPSEFVMTGRHLAIRCDGNSTPHFAFGGPIFYGHAAQGFNEKPDHPGNVFWPQAQQANALYQMLDGKQREQALISFEPAEADVHFQPVEKIEGLPVSEMSEDQRGHLAKVLDSLVEPYRDVDRAEVRSCLESQGGLSACRLSFFETGDLGNDGVWDNWRLEGPSFVWYFRGAPHVHVWVNVANSPAAKISTAG